LIPLFSKPIFWSPILKNLNFWSPILKTSFFIPLF
jgi:hypothetical protein